PSKTTTKKAPAPKAKPSVARAEKKPAEPKKQTPAKAPAPEAVPTPTVAVPAATKAPPAPKTPAEPDPRLPAPGTLIQKRDRHGAVRCECTVEEGGIRYEGSLYRSLSA